MKGVDHRLIDIMDKLIRLMDVTIVEGVRSAERQAELFKSKKSKARVSKHQTGRAIDVAPYPIDWNDTRRFYYMAGLIRGIASELGYNIRLGADWDSDGQITDQTFHDINHVELAGKK